MFQPPSLPLSQNRIDGWLTSRVTISATRGLPAETAGGCDVAKAERDFADVAARCAPSDGQGTVGG